MTHHPEPCGTYEASWPITAEGADMPRAELEAEAKPSLADMLHNEGLQALAEPAFRILYRPHPELHGTVPVAPWEDPVRADRSTPSTGRPAA